jgi:hypothetical protein
MPPQFRLRSLFLLTALVAVGCWVGPPAWHRIQPVFFAPPPPPQANVATVAPIFGSDLTDEQRLDAIFSDVDAWGE